MKITTTLIIMLLFNINLLRANVSPSERPAHSHSQQDSGITQPEQLAEKDPSHAETPRNAASEAPSNDAEKSVMLSTNRPSGSILRVKINALYLGAGVTNFGVEYGLGDRFSIDFPVNFSPYTLKNDYKLRMLTVQPELRYWFCEVFNGHFAGLHAHTGMYNVALDNDKRYQNTQPFYGIGVSYGYNLYLGRNWGLEFTVGAGWINTKYEEIQNKERGYAIDTKTRNYWGLTKAGITVSYQFRIK